MNWKLFKSIIPYLSGLIILLGLIRQMVYYQHYYIEIQNYIGVSELLLAWMDELLIFIIFLLTLLFYIRGSITESTVEDFPTQKGYYILYFVLASICGVIVFITLFYR